MKNYKVAQKSIRQLRDAVIALNPYQEEYVKDEFNNYLNNSIPPMPGFFESMNPEINFPESILYGGEFDKAYNTINKACYKFHDLDENLRYSNQENYFKMYGEYEPLEEEVAVNKNECNFNAYEFMSF